MSRCVRTSLLLTLLLGCSRTEIEPPKVAARVASKPGEPRSKSDLAARIEQARLANLGGNPAAAELILGDVLRADPTNRQALGLLAVVTQRSAQGLSRPRNGPYYLRSAAAVHQLQASHSPLTPEEKTVAQTILYNEACTLALDGESTPALQSLAAAYALGFPRLDLIDTDDDLESLRNLPEFLQLRQTLERNRAIAAFAKNKAGLFPFDFSLHDLEGKTLRLADLKGKIVVVNLWGTWCAPCRKEVPHLVALDARFREKGVAIVGITDEPTEGSQALENVRAFVKRAGIGYRCVIGSEATTRQIPGFPGYPTTLIIDRAGKVRDMIVGYLPDVALESTVSALLEEDKPEKPPAKT